MKLFIDARATFADNRTGKGQWTLQVIFECLQRSDIEVHTLVTSAVPEALQNKVHQHVLPSGWRYFFALHTLLVKQNAAFLLSPTSFLATIFTPRSTKVIMVIHDTIAWRKDPHQWRARYIEKFSFPWLRLRNPIFVTVSDSTKHDLLQLFPSLQRKNVQSVGAGPHDAHPTPALRDEHYFLLPSTLCPRKNQLGAIRAHALLPIALQKKHPLVLVGGRGWQDDTIIQAIEHSPYVQWRGYVNDSEYAAALQHCYALVFPSFYEGFGLPVLDALQRGVPVICSNHGSLAEVAGSAALIVDPYNTQSIADGMQKLCTDSDVYDSLVRAGPLQATQFTWSKTLDTLLYSFTL
jgi:glycosyltransferase involved in cell wall biosynthesis